MKRKMLFMVAAVALLVAACSTETKVLPKKPVITNQLSLQSNQYPQGEDAYPLTVTATTKDKKAKLSYQWYVNTENSAKKGAKIAGATEVEYTPSTETIGEFYYYVEVVSTLNKEKAKTTSDVAVITVVDPAEIPEIGTSNGKEGEVEAGEDILLEVKLPDSIEELVESGEYEVFYQWYDNGNRNSNVGGTPIEGATESSYMPTKTEAGTTFYYAVVTVKDKETGEVVKTLTTSPQKVTVIVNNVGNVGVNAKVPIIREQPASSPPYYVGIAAAPLTVTATVSDDGVLTYQWYRNPEGVDEDNYPIGTGERISGATRASYTPPTNAAGMTIYYVVITNEIEDNQDGGQKTATRTSKVAEVEVVKGINAQTPNITIPPVDASYSLQQISQPLVVTAIVDTTEPGAGTISYQWYKRDTENGVEEPIDGATTRSYTPSTETRGVVFYSVVITNTIDDNGDGGFKTATVESKTVYVAVGVSVITLNVPNLNKVYDGTTDIKTAWTTFTFTPATTLVNASMLAGWSARFAQADAGNNIPIILENFELTGTGAGNYLLRLPAAPTANITKATGAAVTAVTVKGTPLGNKIEVNDVTLDTTDELRLAQQTVEYARGATATIAANLLTWQSSPIFTGMDAATNYYIYARSTEVTNFSAGTYKVSAVIATGQPVVVFEVNGGTHIGTATVDKGQVLPQPAYNATTRAGYRFDYWYTDEELTVPYNFAAAVNNNLTVYAKWVSNDEVDAMAVKDMVWVSGGGFTMGSPTTETNRFNSATNAKIEDQHWVVLSGYFMGKYEVTQEKWQAIMGNNPSNFTTGNEVGTPQKLPVENVSWYEALVFCNKLSMEEDLEPAYIIQGNTNPSFWGLVPTQDNSTWNSVTINPTADGYRLPTEAQWEYACRAGTSTAYHTGATISSADTGWYDANSKVNNVAMTHRVGLKSVNAWGLYDMHGNVAEWCWDYFGYVPNPTPAVSVDPVNTKSDQAWSVLTSTHDNTSSPSWWVYQPSQASLNDYPVTTAQHNTYLAAANALVGANRPSQPYLKLLQVNDFQIAAWTTPSMNSTSILGYYYETWRVPAESPIRGARMIRGGAYNLAADVTRSAARTNTRVWSATAADLPTARPVGNPTYGTLNIYSWTKSSNIGLRVVKQQP